MLLWLMESIDVGKKTTHNYRNVTEEVIRRYPVLVSFMPTCTEKKNKNFCYENLGKQKSY